MSATTIHASGSGPTGGMTTIMATATIGASAYCQLTGRVVKEGGAPLAGVELTVTLVSAPDAVPDFVATSIIGGPPRVAYTEVDGRFSIQIARAASYEVKSPTAGLWTRIVGPATGDLDLGVLLLSQETP